MSPWVIGWLVCLLVMVAGGVVLAACGAHRHALGVGVLALVILLAELAGCAHAPPPAPPPRCPVVSPPAALDTLDEHAQWMEWMRCVPLGWQAGAAQPLFDEAGPSEESDD